MRAAQRLAVVASAHADSVARVGLLAGCYAALAVSAARREEPQEDPATEDLVAWLDNRTRNFDTRGFRIAYPPEVLQFLESAERGEAPDAGGADGPLARFRLGLSVSRRNLVRCRGGKAELLRNYELQKNLGRGGYATVQRAREKQTGLLRAVKVFNSNPRGDELTKAEWDGMLAEVEALMDLTHPNIVQLHECARAGAGARGWAGGVGGGTRAIASATRRRVSLRVSPRA